MAEELIKRNLRILQCSIIRRKALQLEDNGLGGAVKELCVITSLTNCEFFEAKALCNAYAWIHFVIPSSRWEKLRVSV